MAQTENIAPANLLSASFGCGTCDLVGLLAAKADLLATRLAVAQSELAALMTSEVGYVSNQTLETLMNILNGAV